MIMLLLRRRHGHGGNKTTGSGILLHHVPKIAARSDLHVNGLGLGLAAGDGAPPLAFAPCQAKMVGPIASMRLIAPCLMAGSSD